MTQTDSDSDNFLAELWKQISPHERNHFQLVNALEELLVAEGAKKSESILDAAGGFGFPSIELMKRGWFVEYSDASPSMFHAAATEAREEGVSLYDAMMFYGPGVRSWAELSQMDSGIYGAVICMGNSLPHAVTWGKDGNPENAQGSIVNALKQFKRLIRPGGFLYVDKQPEGQQESVDEIQGIHLNGNTFDAIRVAKNSLSKHVRSWNVILHDDSWTSSIGSRGYLMSEQELHENLQAAGFQEIRKVVLRGDCYEGFVAR